MGERSTDGSVPGEARPESVIEQARTGDSTAWKSLVACHLGAVHAICRAFGLDSAAANEVNQAVWLRLAEHLPRIRSAAAIGGWIAATTRRECLRPARTVQRSGWVAGGLTVRLDDGTDPALVAGSATVGRCFARLGASCQRLLRLASVQPSPSDDLISAALDLPAREVPEACRACRKRLERLVRSGGANGRHPGAPARELDQVIATSDPVPGSWWEAAEAAFGWLSIDAVTADVVYDSLVTADTSYGPIEVAAGSAGGGGGGDVSIGTRRSLRFSAGPRQVDVVIDITAGMPDYAEVRLTGRVDPVGLSKASSPNEPDVLARWPGGAVPAPVGPDGRFRLRDLPLAPLSVQVGAYEPATPAVKTGWIFP